MYVPSPWQRKGKVVFLDPLLVENPGLSMSG
jgi:hypothetical protein